MPKKNIANDGAQKAGGGFLVAEDGGAVVMGIGFHGIVFGLLVAGMFGLGGLFSEDVSADLRDVAALLPDLRDVKAMLSDLI